MEPSRKERKEFGPMFGIIIVLVILVAGSVYFLLTKTSPPAGDAQGETSGETS